MADIFRKVLELRISARLIFEWEAESGQLRLSIMFWQLQMSWIMVRIWAVV